ncbi:MAG: ABC transporter substrate binding protein [Pseudomonadota bacterium]
MNAFTIGVTIGISARYRRLVDRLCTTLWCLLACTLLSSCAVVDKFPVFSKPEPVPEIRAQKPPPPPKKLPRVTILQSDDIQAYAGITDELVAQLPESPAILNLHGDTPSSKEIIDQLNQTGNKHVVAIGPLAAQAARQYIDGQVIFCQVFNYLDLGLTAAHMRGVSMLPPAELQFRAWKNLVPGLQRVGVITGHGHEALIDDARKAAQHHGIDLNHRVVQSDKEMLHAFKRLTPEIQGLWLVPDDRVLSLRVLRDIMAYGVKHHRQVVVFHPELLRLGGLMSVGSVDSDVAEQVIAALRDTSGRNKSSAPALLPLKEIRVETNSPVAHELARQSRPGPRVAADAP